MFSITKTSFDVECGGCHTDIKEGEPFLDGIEVRVDPHDVHHALLCLGCVCKIGRLLSSAA